MSRSQSPLEKHSLDSLLFNLESLKNHTELAEVVSQYLEGNYKAVLRSVTSQKLYNELVETASLPRKQQKSALQDAGLGNQGGIVQALLIGLAAFNAFLQANVTGPPLDFAEVFPKNGHGNEVKEQCLRSLDVDGVSVYQHIPYVELFCLAKFIFTVYFPQSKESTFSDSKWMRFRINAYHQRLLSGVSGSRLSDSTVLQDAIDKDLKDLEEEVLCDKSTFSTEAKVQFLLEKAQVYVLQGLDIKARENVNLAKTVSGFSYALSGALGKRTKFQQNDLSQLVVFAKSHEHDASPEAFSKDLKESTISNGDSTKPETLQLNDDTLLESIEFTTDKVNPTNLPSELAGLQPNNQPQLQPLDQITLLTEATIKDTFLPLDKLNSEEILPFALRVLSDKPTNWQIYTQALLVRSRIESHRSRTQERSILQLQVIVDQIIADTQEEPSSDTSEVPEIRVTQFMPRAKASESAPIAERLRYIYQLNTPTRWELETELAYAWSGAGSFVSALEIFKRLKLWAEVALCYHTVGQEEKARQVIRQQLYYSSKGPEMDEFHIDAPELVAENWEGDMRPTPAHAPRLWCILGDLENDPTCWLRAWEISKHRYARAQRSLGEYYVKNGKLEEARDAYMQATIVNRQNNDSWSRLGDLDLRVGNWDGAIIAFQQSIMIDDTDAKTYSNLGSALLSKHKELLTLEKAAAKDAILPSSSSTKDVDSDSEEVSFSKKDNRQDPKVILNQALQAYKRGAAIAHSNWQIYDNVITIAMRLSPPSFPDILTGLRAMLRIRAPSLGEYAIDVDILRALVAEVTTSDRDTPSSYPGESAAESNGKYIPPRGTLGRALIAMLDTEIVPLITKRGELWVLVEKIRFWQRDYEGALRCAERGWRLVMSAAEAEWLVQKEAWKAVVDVTDNLVSAYENYGGMERFGGGEGEEVEKGWRGKARSAVRGVMAKARDAWEGSEDWAVLEGRLEELKV
ncbi:probable TPR repeat-containing protein [Rhynchosporium graminicola]|uniref:Probable TPR repeat-containing protein n=1 Tax=Rhynchosporium graminicola TaxID=2792576 RepID=A0A1E1JSI0_9HELO|nr:probable TPR repeat-containing protein [Rhynchosporium commune]